MIDYAGDTEELDMNIILADAKSKGYKYKKSEIGTNEGFQYAFKYRDGYLKIGLLDQAFSIINDGKKSEVYYSGKNSLLFIRTSIGICAILPFNYEKVSDIEHKTVINMESKHDASVA